MGFTQVSKYKSTLSCTNTLNMTSLNEFLVLFIEELEDTNPEEVTVDTDFKSLDEWDSLVALSVISMIDEEFEVLLTGNDMMKAKTITDLYERIRQLV